MVNITDCRPSASSVVIDRLAAVQMITPKNNVKKFEDYINKAIRDYVLQKAKFYNRIDNIFDVNLPYSLFLKVEEEGPIKKLP